MTPRRWALAALGVVCFGLAFVGAVLPGMPATIFVLVGSYCLARSCPWLEERLLNNRLLKPYTRYVKPGVPFPNSARWAAIGMMSVSVVISGNVLLVSSSLTPGVAGVLAGLWLIGLVAILMFRRGPKAG